MSRPDVPGYPPQPWDLRGQLHASVFLVPMAAFPPGELHTVPPGWSVVQLRGSAVVGAAWVEYGPGGVLAYRELMATVLVRRGLRLAPHIVRIWVDSEASRDGGRALWAIPKELADITVDTALSRGVLSRQVRFTARDGAGPIATGSLRRGLPLPGRWPVAFSVVQTRDGAPLISPVRSRSRLVITRGRWIAEPFGALGFISGRRPVLTITLRDFAMVFGSLPAGSRRGEPVVNTA